MWPWHADPLNYRPLPYPVVSFLLLWQSGLLPPWQQAKPEPLRCCTLTPDLAWRPACAPSDSRKQPHSCPYSWKNFYEPSEWLGLLLH